MVKGSDAHHFTVRCEHLPFIGVVIPTGVIVLHGHIKMKAVVSDVLHLNPDDIRLTGKSGDRHTQDQYDKNDDLTGHWPSPFGGYPFFCRSKASDFSPSWAGISDDKAYSFRYQYRQTRFPFTGD
jgi:hypothetical protein